MIRYYRSILLIALILSTAFASGAEEYDYQIGRGKADVTGPALGMPMWGFVREGQNTEGIHFRLHARAFVIAEPGDGERFAFVSVDLGSITHFMHLSVLDKLREKFGDVYSVNNVTISATHTHSGPAGYWHYGADSPIGVPFYKEHFDAVVEGITAAIAQAHADMQPGNILVNRGQVDGAGANRSMVAYNANPDEERARYDADTDKDMTVLKFVRADGVVGSINWFAVHPTSMTYNNRLISGDHKGHASNLFEDAEGTGFVAAFAQSNCGDVTANLNLDNTGPGENEFETTRIIAERQYAVARTLFDGASEHLSGDIDSRRGYFSFLWKEIDPAFTGGTVQQTCPSAYGYTFAAGSTEDGGGNPLFKEGMTQRNAMIDNIITETFKIPPPSDECRECQDNKAILFAPGEMKPEPGQTQIVPISLTRIGQLVIIAVPAEFTTMSGRRLRDSVAQVLGEDNYYVIAGYSNDYAGYVTTREEYQTQQYEGGHTLYGPWTLSAYQQEFTRLATALQGGASADPGPDPRDLRGEIPIAALGNGGDTRPSSAEFGDLVRKAKRSYKAGSTVEVAFWSGDPQNDFKTGNTFLTIERQDDDAWLPVQSDDGWATKCRWSHPESAPETLQFVATWDIPKGTQSGTYRIVHHGNFKATEDATVEQFERASNPFKVK